MIEEATLALSPLERELLAPIYARLATAQREFELVAFGLAAGRGQRAEQIIDFTEDGLVLAIRTTMKTETES